MKKFKEGNAVKILKITQGYGGKFKVGDTGVVDRFQHGDSFHLVLVGDTCSKNCDDFWHDVNNIELAEDTSKPVTVTHEGNVYQIGQCYLFSMNQLHWTYASLTDIDGGYDKVFCTPEKEWLYIKEVPASENMGTITPAPIELIDGNAYMFDYDNQGNISGVYDSESEKFYFTKGRHVSVSNCMLIRPMTVAESK
tara:strand:- start:4452 stop:5036 length:585 start_codon:yes stop_codon:yes gene_type:complete